jgi:hypothetical protein
VRALENSDFKQNRGVKRRPARDSLIRPINSLMTRFNSLLGRNKFPARTRRELRCKVLTKLLDFEPTADVGGLGYQNSLYFPGLAGNVKGETGSLQTASSSGESAANSIPQELLHHGCDLNPHPVIARFFCPGCNWGNIRADGTVSSHMGLSQCSPRWSHRLARE